MHWSILPSKIAGTLSISPSQSHTMRAYLFAMMANGISQIENPLITTSTETMLKACSQFGAKIEKKGNSIYIEGKGGRLITPNNVIDCGNSSSILHFLGAIATYAPGYVIFTGDAAVREEIDMEPLIDGLMQLGAFAVSTRRNGKAPLIVSGPLLPGKTTIKGKNAGHVAALLMAAAFSEGPVEIHVEEPQESVWIEMTLSWLDRIGARYQKRGERDYRVEGDTQVAPFSYRVPGDLSSAYFSIAAALATQSVIEVKNLDLTASKKELFFFDLIEKMGAKVDRMQNSVYIHSSALRGVDIDLSSCGDSLPLAVVLGCFAKGKTRLHNASKGALLLKNIVSELRKMGAQIDEQEDFLVIHPSKLKGNILTGVKDHRLAMALSVAALGAEGGSHIEEVETANRNYPSFVEDLKKLGAKFE